MNRLVVVSNRVPLPNERRSTQGGLAMGVLAALRETGGLWFGWDGNILDPTPTDIKLIEDKNVTFATISLSNKDYEDYYAGYSNRVLWPLFHSRLNLVEFQREQFDGYLRVNGLFARKLAPLLQPDDLIWIHDYHYIPVATELRRAGVTQPIGFFLHIPFPCFDIIRALPNFEQMLHHLCTYNLIGFHTDLDMHAFLDSIELGIGAKIDPSGTIAISGKKPVAGVFPIGIDVENTVGDAAKGHRSKQGKRLLESLNGRKLIIGVDRLDYSKGLVERFRAMERLLERYPDNRGRVVLMQVAQPSRSDVPEYEEIRSDLEAVAGEINGRFSEYDWAPLRYLNKSFVRPTIMGFLAIGKVGLITPLRDGMNLVAKEFVAAQDPGDPGVLVLSHLTGAARELESAVIVNPYDVDDIADGIARAITMPLEERIERWESAMKIIRNNDIHAWRQSFIDSLRQLA